MVQIILLSLDRHINGIWIRRLQGDLEKKGAYVNVISLESILANHDTTDSQIEELLEADLIVNRVSDAAEPWLVKGFLAIMHLIDGSKLINGTRAYALCTNKWCHHVLFRRAGLSSPKTIKIQTPMASEDLLKALNHDTFDRYIQSFLLKPNSGGFGAGILKIEKSSIPTDLPLFEDHTGVLQQYIKPVDNCIYRIWFLSGRVLCGVRRPIEGKESDLTSGCSDTSCAYRPREQRPKLEAIQISLEVRSEIEGRLLPLLPDADMGSVEYLIDSRRARKYFDLNLLSTLPLPETVENAAEMWGDEFDPWEITAENILDRNSSKEEQVDGKLKTGFILN